MRSDHLLPILACLCSPLLFAQGEADVDDSGTIFSLVEQMPEFPGGEAALFAFLGDHIRYPKSALDADISGVVYITFVVETDGSIADVRVLRGIGGGCDEEAVRVVEAMPRWAPGRAKGETVRVQYNLPIRYTIRHTEREAHPIHEEVDLLPRFPGGQTALNDYLAATVVQPPKARKARGTVRVRFEVDRDGLVRDAAVVQAVHPDLDAEALRVVQAMPPWQPALRHGRVVRAVTEVQVPFLGRRKR